MRCPTLLTRSRHGIYYFRWPIPASLHPERQRKTVKVSLQTRDPQLALRLGHSPRYAGEGTLAQARDRRDQAKSLLAANKDPSAERAAVTAQKEVEQACRFETVGRAWLDGKREALVGSYSSRILARLEDDVFPEIGKLHVGRIEPPVLLKAIRKIGAQLSSPKGSRTIAARF